MTQLDIPLVVFGLPIVPPTYRFWREMAYEQRSVMVIVIYFGMGGQSVGRTITQRASEITQQQGQISVRNQQAKKRKTTADA